MDRNELIQCAIVTADCVGSHGTNFQFSVDSLEQFAQRIRAAALTECADYLAYSFEDDFEHNYQYASALLALSDGTNRIPQHDGIERHRIAKQRIAELEKDCDILQTNLDAALMQVRQLREALHGITTKCAANTVPLYTAPPAIDDETKRMVLELCRLIIDKAGPDSMITRAMAQKAEKISERLEAGE